MFPNLMSSSLGTESNAQVLSQFRAKLREDFRTELLACGVIELEKAYTLVQGLDAAKFSYTFKSQIQVPKSNSNQYPNRFQAQMSTPKTNTNGKDIKGKGIEEGILQSWSHNQMLEVPKL